MKAGRAATMTHDYKRNGTTALFAALDAAEGKVIGICQQRHRHQEWIKFMRSTPRQGTASDPRQLRPAQAPEGPALAGGNTRFHLHSTPTSASWLNMVERFFRDLTPNRLRRGVFASAADLVDAVHD